MSIWNHTNDTYFFLYQDTVCYNWRLAAPSSTSRRSRFHTSPPDGGFVRNDWTKWRISWIFHNLV